MSRGLKRPREEIEAALELLMELGLVEKLKSGIIKRKHRKIKPKKETKPHHTYYVATRRGDQLVRGLKG
jgi:predicted transcriptional regulator